MIFTNRSPEDIDISIEGQRLVKSEHERFLGVIIDSKFSWSYQMIYNSLIQSHLYHCATVWGTKSLNSTQSLFSAQKKVIRATNTEFNNYFYDKKNLNFHLTRKLSSTK